MEWRQVLNELQDVDKYYQHKEHQIRQLLKDLGTALRERDTTVAEWKLLAANTGRRHGEHGPRNDLQRGADALSHLSGDSRRTSGPRYGCPRRVTPGVWYSRAILGRMVKNCHPPRSVDVAEILDPVYGSVRAFRYFAVRGGDGRYPGTLEVTRDVGPTRALEGERWLLEHGAPVAAVAQ